MRNLLISLCLCFSLLIPTTTSFAQGRKGPLHIYRKLTTALLGSADTTVSRSFSLARLAGWGLLVVYVDHHTHATLTKVVMNCTATNDAGTTDFEIQDCTLILGDCRSEDATWTKGDPTAISGVKRWPWRIDIMGYEQVDCTLTFTGGSAGDFITLEGTQMSQ